MFLDILLYIIACVLFVPLTVINFIIVSFQGKGKGYFHSTAVSIDKLGNREFRTLFNLTLITKDGYQFGTNDETVSSVLGRNKLKGTLSRTGRILDYILDKIDKNHSIKSIDETIIV